MIFLLNLYFHLFGVNGSGKNNATAIHKLLWLNKQLKRLDLRAAIFEGGKIQRHFFSWHRRGMHRVCQWAMALKMTIHVYHCVNCIWFISWSFDSTSKGVLQKIPNCTEYFDSSMGLQWYSSRNIYSSMPNDAYLSTYYAIIGSDNGLPLVLLQDII